MLLPKSGTAFCGLCCFLLLWRAGQCHQYITFHNLFVPAQKSAVINLTLFGDEPNSVQWAFLDVRNNWMYPSSAFDVVVTTSKEEKDKIVNPSESCQLLIGETYTYRTSFTQNFSLADKTVNLF